jgi:hypothetical protein
MDLKLINKINQRAGRVSQAVEHLPSKCEALSSSPSIKKTKTKTD